MKPIIESIPFYPYRKVIINNCEYRIERYDVVKKQWVTLQDFYTDEAACQSAIDEYNIESGLVKETYIVGYTND
jgi:hypothetical protein